MGESLWLTEHFNLNTSTMMVLKYFHGIWLNKDIIVHELLYSSLIYCFSLFQSIIYVSNIECFSKKHSIMKNLFKVVRIYQALSLFSCKVSTKRFAPSVSLYQGAYLTYTTQPQFTSSTVLDLTQLQRWITKEQPMQNWRESRTQRGRKENLGFLKVLFQWLSRN